MADALKWSGTFHAIGARLIREYAEQIGLDRSFTIHDREDSADLMNLSGTTSDFPRPRSDFPLTGTCLAIYSRAVNSETPLDQLLGSVFPWCAMWHAELRRLFFAYVEAKQNQNVLDYDDLLLYWAQMMAEPAIATDVSRPLRPRAGRRIPRHEPPAGLDPALAQARRPRLDCGRG
jgi:Superfamily I DNA and RNA helicases